MPTAFRNAKASSSTPCARRLNMSEIDVPVQLYFALFNGTHGFVLKPKEMLDPTAYHEDAYWPPPREHLHCAIFEVLALLTPQGEGSPILPAAHQK
eukprot:6873167-Prymnesium_polylepis.4